MAAGYQHRRRELILLRGCPGSGKTFLAQQLQGGGVSLSTDDFFIGPDGMYTFNHLELHRAHKWNQRRAQEAMRRGTSPVIIDNTNVTLREMKPYAEMALEAGYYIHMREPKTPWRYDAKQCARRTLHGVPQSVIQGMLDKFRRDLTVRDLLDTIPQQERNVQSHAPQQLPARHNNEPVMGPQEANLLASVMMGISMIKQMRNLTIGCSSQNSPERGQRGGGNERGNSRGGNNNQGGGNSRGGNSNASGSKSRGGSTNQGSNSRGGHNNQGGHNYRGGHNTRGGHNNRGGHNTPGGHNNRGRGAVRGTVVAGGWELL